MDLGKEFFYLRTQKNQAGYSQWQALPAVKKARVQQDNQEDVA
jgi:hypothetical protein